MLNNFLNFVYVSLVRLAQSDLNIFLILGLSMLGLYGVVVIIYNLILFFKR